jgi:hypothetical protein
MTVGFGSGPGLSLREEFDPNSVRGTLVPDFHGLFNVPSATALAVLDDYNDSSSSSTTIYQLAGGVYNTGTRPSVAVAGFARGKQVWGANYVVMADGASSAASGIEVDFGIVSAGVGTAVGLALHAHNASGNPAGYLQMLARNGLDQPAPRYGIQMSVNGGTDQPLQSAGVIFETSGAIQTSYGLDFHSAAFSTAAAYLPVNRGSAGASVGIRLEAAGGLANSGSALEIRAADSSSTVAYGIRFAAQTSKPPVAATGALIYVDGGSYAQALDISAATFASSGAIAMGDNNISCGTATGMKIGTGTTQKLAFYNATPIAQFATTGTSAGFTAGAGTAVTHLSTFTGNTGSAAYTLGDVVRALKQLGLIAA